MKKILFTLLCAANMLTSLALDKGSVLDQDKVTLDGYKSDDFMQVLTADGFNSVWSPCFINNDTEDKIFSINGINDNGIVNIAEIKYSADNFGVESIAQEQYPSEHGGPGICFATQLVWLQEKIDVDFNYLFVIQTYSSSDYDNRLRQLVNERGDVIYTFPSNSDNFFYSEALFYISYHYSTGVYPNQINKCEVINLASLLKDYSTKVTRAKADAVNSKSTKTYNIQGMEEDEDAKGIVIENGAKYIKE